MSSEQQPRGKQRKRVTPVAVVDESGAFNLESPSAWQQQQKCSANQLQSAKTTPTRAATRDENGSNAKALGETLQASIVSSPSFSRKGAATPSTGSTTLSFTNSHQHQASASVAAAAFEVESAATGFASKAQSEYSSDESSSTDIPVQQARAQDEYDGEECDNPPPTQQLASQCWKCQVTLKIDGGFCMYAMHTHPHLQVPVCSVCVEEIAYPGTEDYCAGCGEEEETLFLCDACPRAFCLVCTAKAYGGSSAGLQKAQALQDDDTSWECPICDPSPELQALQQLLGATADEDNGTSDDQNPRSAEEALEQLYKVENEKRTCQKEMDDPDAVDVKCKEVRQDFRESNPGLSAAELEEMVDEEMETWKELCTRHDARLSDMAASLQEELETLHNVDLAKFYKKYFGEESEQRAGDGLEQQQDEPWKLAADREIAERNMKEKKSSNDFLDPEVYKKFVPEEVEDLETHSEDERSCGGGGFRHTDLRPSREDIDDAIAVEDALFAERKISIRKKYSNEMDVRENVVQERETCRQGTGGVGRVRRDDFVAIAKVRRKRGVAAAKSKEKSACSLAATNDEVRQPLQPPEVAAAASLKKSRETAGIKSKALQKRPPPSAVAENGIVDLTDDVAPNHLQKIAPAVAHASIPGAQPKHGESEFDRDAKAQHGDGESGDMDEEYYCSNQKEYVESQLELPAPRTYRTASGRRVKSLKVTRELEKHLKPHQREGVQFLWRNAFYDLSVRTSRDEQLDEARDIGGALLSHNMGLGKSLTAITTLHTAMNHPSLTDKQGNQLIRTALLIVPLNTLTAWMGEFRKWSAKLNPSTLVFHLHNNKGESRSLVIDDWVRHGGVLLVGINILSRVSKQNPSVLGADCVVLDESHLMLSNRNTEMYRALDTIKTKRRLLLTGSPLQNNVTEYYRMVQWMRPGVLDDSEAVFDREFTNPIMKGMASDATKEAVWESGLRSAQLQNILSPYVHRKDATVLREDLPAMQQVVIHTRQTKMQTNLYKELKRFEKRKNITGFFKRFHLSRPIHNHPACLLMSSRDGGSDSESDSIDSDSEDGTCNKQPWWQRFVANQGADKVKAVENGPKVVLLLHILAHSLQIGDKVVCFTQCLRTLDFIEEVLGTANWPDYVQSLASAFPGLNIGGWTKGVEYLRIDGNIDSETRGRYIRRFNAVESSPSEGVQLFLISSKAGGIGITLTAANRVVLFDSHYNPTLMSQCLYRCYRYGQEKQVFAYRFLTEGTGEEKIYSRSVNKTGLALRLLDGKNIAKSFTEAELSNLVLNDTWVQVSISVHSIYRSLLCYRTLTEGVVVQCDKCEKWRMLCGQEEENLPERWYCHLNENDPVNNTCDASQKDNRWYYSHFKLNYISITDPDSGKEETREQHTVLPSPAKPTGVLGSKTDYDDDEWDEKKELLVENDEVLRKLLSPRSDTAGLVSKYYFHEALLETCDDDDTKDAAEAMDTMDDNPTAAKENEDESNTAAAEDSTKPLRGTRPSQAAIETTADSHADATTPRTKMMSDNAKLGTPYKQRSKKMPPRTKEKHFAMPQKTSDGINMDERREKKRPVQKEMDEGSSCSKRVRLDLDNDDDDESDNDAESTRSELQIPVTPSKGRRMPKADDPSTSKKGGLVASSGKTDSNDGHRRKSHTLAGIRRKSSGPVAITRKDSETIKNGRKLSKSLGETKLKKKSHLCTAEVIDLLDSSDEE